MRALELTGPRQFVLTEMPTPTPGPGQVLVKVAYAGICGSDLAIAESGPVFGADYQHPILHLNGGMGFGHEFSGHIDALGEGVTGLEPGALVAIRANVWDGTCDACLRGNHHLCVNGGFIGVQGGGGAFSDYILVNPDQIFTLPEPFTERTGALVEPLAVGWHAVRRARLQRGDSALIVGGGPVGLSVLLALKAQGIDKITLSEPSPARRALAERLGATVVDPAEAGEVRGMDASFEAAGIGEATFATALNSLRPDGTLVYVATGHHELPVHPLTLMLTEVNLTGSNSYDDVDYAGVISAVADGRMDPQVLISSEISLENIVAAGFDHLFAEGRNTEVKMLVRP